MARGGARLGAGRKPKGPVQPPEPPDGVERQERPKFDSPIAFGLWALNAPDWEVTIDQKLRAMQVLVLAESKSGNSAAEKKEQQRDGIADAMQGIYAPRRVRSFGVVEGGR